MMSLPGDYCIQSKKQLHCFIHSNVVGMVLHGRSAESGFCWNGWYFIFFNGAKVFPWFSVQE